MKRITKRHGFHVYVAFENVGNGWCVCVCVCARACGVPRCTAGSLPSLFVSLYDTYEAEPLGRNWHISLTVGLKTRDAADTHEGDALGRNCYDLLTAERDSYVSVLRNRDMVMSAAPTAFLNYMSGKHGLIRILIPSKHLYLVQFEMRHMKEFSSFNTSCYFPA